MENKVLPVKANDPQQVAEQTLPYFDDGKKSEYLSYRLCDFSEMQSIQLSKIHHKTVMRWREADPLFKSLDMNIDGALVKARKELSINYLDIQYTRNFRLVMQKDFEVLFKSVTVPLTMTEMDKEYLMKIRAMYTPQQLAQIKMMLSGGDNKEPFDFTRLTLTIRREREVTEVKMEPSDA